MNDAEQAQRWGIETGYHDVFGQWHPAPAQTVSRLLAAVSRGQAQPVNVAVSEQGGLRAFQGDGARCWGLAVQLYAVRSARNWGIGDFSDLAEIVRIAARNGASAVGLNPLHVLFPEQPERASPYAPNSRLFLNPLFIDLESVLEFSATDKAALEADITESRAGDLVDYSRVAGLKMRALRTAYERFSAGATPARRDAFEAYRRAQGDLLLRFSCFEVLRRRFAPATWREWPAPWSRPDRDALEDFRRSEARECEFHEFVQWVAHEQLAHSKTIARECALPIGLYLDLAVGVDPQGADAWSNQNAILSDFSIGAPPDQFNPGGQDWGLAPFNPQALPDNDFYAIRTLLAATMRPAGAVRLDHVLSLMRLFLIPRGEGASQGTYLRFPFESLLQVIAQESNRYRCVFIGEDLGTVPEGFREIAGRWGIWSYRVMLFERHGAGEFNWSQDYPVEALAAFNTHDLPTFRGWMSGHDLNVKRAIGIDPGESDEERERSRSALRAALSRECSEYTSDDFAAVAAYLGATRSRLVIVAVEDLLDVADQVNIPATVDQHPNWRRKLPLPLEDWERHPTWRKTVHALRAAGRMPVG